MKEKETILAYVAELIANNTGLQIQSKGKSIASYSENKDLKLEIAFQIPRYSTEKNLEVFPHLVISSRTLEKWWKDFIITRLSTAGADKSPLNRKHDGIFFSTFLGYITPRKPRYEWLISGFNQEQSVQQISESIIKYAVPFFKKLTDTNKVIDEVCENVWGISSGIEYNIFNPPIDFVLCYGSVEKAQRLLNTILGQNTYWKSHIIARYQEIDKRNTKNIDEILGFGESWINLCYLHELKIH